MPERSFLARWFLVGGAALAVLGFALWLTLPIPLSFPPYLPTALLALALGAAFLLQSHLRRRKP